MLPEMERNNQKLIETLTRGRNSAKRLHNLLRQKGNDYELISVEKLVTEISESFYGCLLMLNSCNSGDICGVPVTPSKKPTPGVKVQRGSYKRRNTVDSRMEVSSTIEDGYAWRKYGQKEILNYRFPRCYFRCTHKHVHGCKAVKQVQKLEDEPNMFHITYIGFHTCSSNANFSNPDQVVLDCKDSKNHQYLQSSPSTINYDHPSLLEKQEDLCDSMVYSAVINDAQSSSRSAMVWDEILKNDLESFKNYGANLSDIISFYNDV